MAFVPTPFTTPVIAPNSYQAYREAPYISPSQYRFAPTAVATNGLVAGSSSESTDSTASLAQVIQRASAWIDNHCFHRSDGSLVSSITVEQMMVTLKPGGQAVFLVNFKPLRQLVGLALGPYSGNLQSVSSQTAAAIILGEKSFTLPGWSYQGNTTGFVTPWPTVDGRILGVYSYIAGWPHSTLSASVAAGSTTLTVNPPVPGATTLYGAYAGTPLTIKDGANTETVVLASDPTGLTLNLVSGTTFSHALPAAPDATMVTALPSSVEQACISVVNVLLKTQGMRAQVLPGSIGAATPNQKQAMARAGALGDFELAESLLKPFQTVYVH